MRGQYLGFKCIVLLYLALGWGASAAEGVYFGSSVSSVEAEYESNITLTGGSSLADQDDGVKVFGGYRFNSLLAIEVQYMKFGEITLTMPSGSTVTKSGVLVTNSGGSTAITNYEPESLGFGGMLTIPFQAVQPYLKYGVHNWDTSKAVGVGSADVFGANADGTDLYRGFGFDIPLNDLFFTRLEYEVYDFDDDKLSVFNWGIFLQF